VRDCTVDELEGHAVEGIYTAIRDRLTAEGTSREERVVADYGRVRLALDALQGVADARLTAMGAWADVGAELGIPEDDDHGPGCDGPWNCVCGQPSHLPR